MTRMLLSGYPSFAVPSITIGGWSSLSATSKKRKAVTRVVRTRPVHTRARPAETTGGRETGESRATAVMTGSGKGVCPSDGRSRPDSSATHRRPLRLDQEALRLGSLLRVQRDQPVHPGPDPRGHHPGLRIEDVGGQRVGSPARKEEPELAAADALAHARRERPLCDSQSRNDQGEQGARVVGCDDV